VPRINKEYYPGTEVYKTLAKEANALGEKDCCSVMSVAAITGLPFAKVQEVFREAGRKDRKPTPVIITENVLKELGYKCTTVAPRTFIDQYPEVHKRVLKSVTAHHPDRFPHVFRNGKAYLFCTADHMFAVINGEVHDHARGSRVQVKKIFEVVRL
jgi:hypothetical protein